MPAEVVYRRVGTAKRNKYKYGRGLPGPPEPFKRDTYRVPGKEQLNEQAGFLVSRSLTLPSNTPWAGGVIR